MFERNVLWKGPRDKVGREEPPEVHAEHGRNQLWLLAEIEERQEQRGEQPRHER